MNIRPVALLGIVAVFATAANPVRLSASRNSASIRVETRLIEVNVVARDSHGRPVEGLTKDDFRLYDNGKRVPIDVFSAISLAPAPSKPLSPNVFSNRLPGAPPSVTVVLLDDLNTSFADQAWARAEVVRFLEEIKPQDRVAILLLRSRHFVLQSFTSDPKILLTALKNARTGDLKDVEGSLPPQLPGGEVAPQGSEAQGSAPTSVAVNGAAGSRSTSAGGPGASRGMAGAAADEARMEQIMLEFQEHESASFMTDRVDRTADALMAIARYLAHFPGRKNLIWVSASFPTAIGFMRPREPGNTRDQVVYTEPLQKSYRALNNADIAVYAVDARGLGGIQPDMNRFPATVATMQELAAETGGRAFYNTNDIAQVMRAAVDDSDADYTIGFYPQNIHWDGRYHTLKVKVVERGVHLRYRRGYYATQQAPKDETQADVALDRAIYAPLDSTGLGLTVSVLKSVLAPDRRMELAIDMDGHDITLQGEAASRSANLEVVLAQSNAEGKVVHTDSYNMKLRVAASGVRSLMKNGFIVTRWVRLVHGAETLDVVVRNPTSGNIGSVHIPVQN